eukprot:3739661-Heterocapsa_arctica.AAC.1
MDGPRVFRTSTSGTKHSGLKCSHKWRPWGTYPGSLEGIGTCNPMNYGCTRWRPVTRVSSQGEDSAVVFVSPPQPLLAKLRPLLRGPAQRDHTHASPGQAHPKSGHQSDWGMGIGRGADTAAWVGALEAECAAAKGELAYGAFIDCENVTTTYPSTGSGKKAPPTETLPDWSRWR